MRSIIRQSVVLPASAEKLYKMYLNPKLHAAITGAPVTIKEKRGAAFKAFGGALSGTMLAGVKNKLIVQSWRSMMFRKSDPDSTLILHFSDVGKNGRIDLIHLDVPKQDFAGATKGWKKYYWTPWKKYLTKKK